MIRGNLSRRRLLGVLAAGALGSAPRPTRAQTPAPQTREDQADIRRIEEYMNTLRTMRAKFMQIDAGGGRSTGTFYMWRPGRMRLQYDPPNPNLLVANGSFLIHHDRALKTTAHLGLDSTPLGIMLRDNVKLGGDVTVTKVERSATALRLSLIQTKDPGAGRLELTFALRPFGLDNWRLIDGKNRPTRIVLLEARAGMPLDPALFRFTEPLPGRGND